MTVWRLIYKEKGCLPVTYGTYNHEHEARVAKKELKELYPDTVWCVVKGRA